MTIRYEPNTLVTPTLARKWLGQNAENNRKPKTARIPQYARDMHNGNWRATGETIKFDPSGVLLDGQNRLYAAIEASEMKCTGACMHGPDGPPPVRLDVMYDVPPEAMEVMDTGSSRTFGDVLRITHARNNNQVAAVVRWTILWDLGRHTGGGNPSPTHAEMMVRYRADSDRYDTAGARGRDVMLQGLAPSAAVSTAFYLFHRIHADQAHAFYDKFVSGAEMSDLHPVLTLRKRLIRDKGRLTRQEILAMTIRAWNAFREERTLASIYATTAPKLTNENFPVPR
jgi:hypothetical protein